MGEGSVEAGVAATEGAAEGAAERAAEGAAAADQSVVPRPAAAAVGTSGRAKAEPKLRPKTKAGQARAGEDMSAWCRRLQLLRRRKTRWPLLYRTVGRCQATRRSRWRGM